MVVAVLVAIGGEYEIEFLLYFLLQNFISAIFRETTASRKWGECN